MAVCVKFCFSLLRFDLALFWAIARVDEVLSTAANADRWFLNQSLRVIGITKGISVRLRLFQSDENAITVVMILHCSSFGLHSTLLDLRSFTKSGR